MEVVRHISQRPLRLTYFRDEIPVQRRSPIWYVQIVLEPNLASIASIAATNPIKEKRQAEASRILQKFNDRIPVICEKVEKSDIAEIDKRKYLVPSDLTVGQFVYVIRKRIKLPSEKAIFIFVNDILPPTAALLSTVYEEHKDEDGFLYVLYSGENTFGDLEGVEEIA